MDKNKTNQGAACTTCHCPHHKMMPLLLVLIGLAFLLRTAGVITDNLLAYLWPSLLILIGLQKMFGHCCGCCRK